MREKEEEGDTSLTVISFIPAPVLIPIRKESNVFCSWVRFYIHKAESICPLNEEKNLSIQGSLNRSIFYYTKLLLARLLNAFPSGISHEEAMKFIISKSTVIILPPKNGSINQDEQSNDTQRLCFYKD